MVIDSNDMEQVRGITAEYPYTLHRDDRQTRAPWHWHEEVEFGFVRKGAVRVTVSGHSYVFRKNEGYFINSNILHTMEPVDSQEEIFWDSHIFHPVFLGGHYRSVFTTHYLDPVLKNKKYELIPLRQEEPQQAQILALLRQASDVQGQENSEFKTRNLFSDVWLLLRKVLEDLENSAKLAKPVSQERIQIMLAFIHRHYPEKLTLEQIADSAIVSRRECLRCFQNCIQKTPFEYLLDYRIQVAEKLLRTTDLPVTEIALQTGFSNSAYFAKTFKQLRDISPSAYRKLVSK